MYRQFPQPSDDSSQSSSSLSEDSKQLNDPGEAPLIIPEGMPIKQGGMLICRPLSSRISEISFGIDHAALSDNDEDEEVPIKKGLHQPRNRLQSLFPIIDSDEDDDDGDDSVQKKGDGKSKIKGKSIMSVQDHIVNDEYGDAGFYTGNVTEEAMVPHGHGVMMYANARIYEGEWENGRWNGKGKWTNSNGDEYEGEFVDDKRYGFGTYKWPNGNKYIGQFEDDNRHGKGKLEFQNNAVYEGDFVRGHFEGKGSYSFGTGIYEGEWKAGKYEGQGFLLNQDGSSYTGEFETGIQHGRGEEILPDGKTIKGRWHRGRRPYY